MIHFGKKTFTGVVVLACLVCTAAVGHAAAISLSAPGVNLDYLPIGVPVSISVQLSGLETGQELAFLAATIGYDRTLLGEPVVSAGEIVPDPLGALGDFLPCEGPGKADAAFTTEETAACYHITSEGTFFSFVLTPLTTGGGSFTIDFSDCMLYEPNEPLVLDEGPPLDFTVVVPEPSAVVFLIALAAGLCMRRFLE